MPGSLMIDGSAVLNHFRKLREYGVSKEILEGALELTQEDIKKYDARVPFLNNINMIEKGASLIGPDVALRLGSAISLEHMGICGHIFKSCKNLDEVVDLFIRYQRLLYAVSRFELRATSYQVILKHIVDNPIFIVHKQLMVELAFSSILSTIRNLLKDTITPIAAYFSYKQPDYISKYKEVFECDLLFNQKTDQMVFDRKVIDKEIPTMQIYIKDILVKHANGLLNNIVRSGGLTAEVNNLILLYLPRGSVDINIISNELNMSRWTLTRKLKAEGTTFRKLLTNIKKELSFNYLRNRELSIGEISFLLGYSEISTFRRAFKDWSGKNPTTYRQEILF